MGELISSSVIDKINSLIKDDDDLSNLDNLIVSINKEKSTIDSQLKIDEERHIKQIDLMINSLQSSHKNLQDLKYSVKKLNELSSKNDDNNELQDFKIFDDCAVIFKNINLVEDLFKNFVNFDKNCKFISNLLDQEFEKDENGYLIESNGDNLLTIHYELNILRNFQDKNYYLSKNSQHDLSKFLEKFNITLNNCIKKFDEYLNLIIESTLDLIYSENFSFLIKLVKVIQFEEIEDLKVRLWNDLMHKKGENEVNGNDLNLVNNKRLKEREYKKKFDSMFDSNLNYMFGNLKVEELPSYYDSMIAFQIGINQCFPKEWNYFNRVLENSQNILRKILVDERIQDTNDIDSNTLSDIIELDFNNRKWLKNNLKLENKYLDKIRLLSTEKKKQLLDNQLQKFINQTDEWMNNALKKSTQEFESLNEPKNDNNNIKLPFQMSANVMLILSSHIKNIRLISDSTILVQYLSFFSNTILKKYQEEWTVVLDKMLPIWSNSINNNEIINPNIGYLPRYITGLVNDVFELIDALEKDFDNITMGVSEKFQISLLKAKDIASGLIDELGSSCLDKLSKVALADFGSLMNDLFNKKWYKSSEIIDITLDTIIHYLDNFKEYTNPQINGYELLSDSFLDFLTDDLILKYLDCFNFKRPLENSKTANCLKRDYEKILNALLPLQQEDLLSEKFEIFEVLIDLVSIDNKSTGEEFINMWENSLKIYFDLPIDLLKIILECKKVDKSKITLILSKCNDLCVQSITENIDSPGNIFRNFHYNPKK